MIQYILGGALAVFVLAGCSRLEQRSDLRYFEKVDSECKAGLRSGEACERAGRAITNDQNIQAREAFRSMRGES